MLVCDRCGESYHKGSKFSTDDYCGTCIFINGPLPEPKVQGVTYSSPRAAKGRLDPEDTPLV